LTFIIIIIIIYALFDPAQNAYFPKCPFNEITGYKCPGCGSQRAIHAILNFNIVQAFRENLLLVLSIPYLLTAFVFDAIKKPGDKLLKWRKILFGTNAIFIILGFIIAFWILRNVWGY